MSGYTKLFSSILASTVWREPKHVRIVWITMLAMADKHGMVEAAVPGLADFARVSLDECNEALLRLTTPDPYSRTKEHDGRRIAEIDGGWHILNHGKYRAKMSAEDRREYNRIKQQESRARQRMSNNVKDSLTREQNQHNAEAEAEAEGGSKSPNGRQPSTARMIVLDQELKRIDVKIGDIRNSYDAHQTMDENDREKLKELKAKRAKVRKELGLD